MRTPVRRFGFVKSPKRFCRRIDVLRKDGTAAKNHCAGCILRPRLPVSSPHGGSGKIPKCKQLFRETGKRIPRARLPSVVERCRAPSSAAERCRATLDRASKRDRQSAKKWNSLRGGFLSGIALQTGSQKVEPAFLRFVPGKTQLLSNVGGLLANCRTST